jgi:hypothetical protein
MSHYEDLNTTKIALIGFISTVVVFAVILLMIVLFHREMSELQQTKVIDQPAVEFATLTASQQGELATYRWIDREKKIVQIPIKQAMGIVVAELNEKSAPSEKSADRSRIQSAREKQAPEKATPDPPPQSDSPTNEGKNGDS